MSKESSNKDGKEGNNRFPLLVEPAEISILDDSSLFRIPDTPDDMVMDVQDDEEKDADTEKVKCSENCKLNVFGLTFQIVWRVFYHRGLKKLLPQLWENS